MLRPQGPKEALRRHVLYHHIKKKKLSRKLTIWIHYFSFYISLTYFFSQAYTQSRAFRGQGTGELVDKTHAEKSESLNSFSDYFTYIFWFFSSSKKKKLNKTTEKYLRVLKDIKISHSSYPTGEFLPIPWPGLTLPLLPYSRVYAVQSCPFQHFSADEKLKQVHRE